MSGAGAGWLGAVLVAAGCAAPAAGAVWSLRLDPATAKVTFTLGATLHTVEGSLPLTSGEVRFDPGTGEASGRLVLDATGAATGSEGRDKKMHAEVLASAHFPEIVFTVRRAEVRVDPAGRGTVTMTGTLAIAGGEHVLAIAARVVRDGARVRAEGGFEVPYVSWGLKDPSAFVLRVAKVVEVSFVAEGTLAELPGESRP
jgi:polyisoprenoid-binding protein YceI